MLEQTENKKYTIVIGEHGYGLFDFTKQCNTLDELREALAHIRRLNTFKKCWRDMVATPINKIRTKDISNDGMYYLDDGELFVKIYTN